jgi:hypothetical protein
MNSTTSNYTVWDTASLPEDILNLIDDDFFRAIESLVGDHVVEILQIQLINSARKLLNTPDVFLFFQIESEQTDRIKEKSCFKCKTGQYIVKPGIRAGFSYLNNLLEMKVKQEQDIISEDSVNIEKDCANDDFLARNPLLKSLIKWYQEKNSIDISQHQFLVSFIDNLVYNIIRPSNRFRHNETVKNFAASLYVLGGKQAYEFVRLNLYGSIPNLSTLGDIINESNVAVTEGKFNFDMFEQYESRFGFCSEDTTGVIRKIQYDSPTNTFVGFATPIVDGVPMAQSYQADTFNELKDLFETKEIAPLLNVHMFQNIPTADNETQVAKPFLLSAYGVNNKFTAVDILCRWIHMFERCLERGVRIIGFSTGNF